MTIIAQMRLGRSISGNNIAKPILLSSIISFIEENIITENEFYFDLLIDKYYILFKDKRDYVTKMEYPFYYIKNDGFWHLKWKESKEENRKTPSSRFICNNIEYAYFDKDLWALLQDVSSRQKIKEVVVRLIEN